MDRQTFAASPCGRVIRTRTGYDAYLPDPLPASIEWQSRTAVAMERAALLLGRLSERLDDEAHGYRSLLLVRDATAAVRSEGMTLSFTDYVAAMATGRLDGGAVRLALNYATTLEHAHNRLEELPLSLRLMREMHHRLGREVTDARAVPGEFRTSQNWIGEPGCTLSNAVFVPPPPTEMQGLLDNWERYLHSPVGIPNLALLALTQYQYLVIHPFLTMNVLTGALIASVTLQHLGLARRPVPVFGRFLEQSGQLMEVRLLDVCARGRWEGWLEWYLHGLADTAAETLETSRRLELLHGEKRRRLSTSEAADGVRPLLDLLFEHPALTPDFAAQRTGLTAVEAAQGITELESLGLVFRPTAPCDEVHLATDIITTLDARPGISGVDYDRF